MILVRGIRGHRRRPSARRRLVARRRGGSVSGGRFDVLRPFGPDTAPGGASARDGAVARRRPLRLVVEVPGLPSNRISFMDLSEARTASLSWRSDEEALLRIPRRRTRQRPGAPDVLSGEASRRAHAYVVRGMRNAPTVGAPARLHFGLGQHAAVRRSTRPPDARRGEDSALRATGSTRQRVVFAARFQREHERRRRWTRARGGGSRRATGYVALSVSNAFWISSNISRSPPLSGCSRTRATRARYAF